MSNPPIFGIEYSYSESNIIIIPVPWDVTASYGGGASLGPKHILDASPQLDFFDLFYGTPLDQKIHMLPIPEEVYKKNIQLRPWAQEIQKKHDEGVEYSNIDRKRLKLINEACEDVHDWVSLQSKNALHNGKHPVLVGGDHSTPFGLIRELSTLGDYGILQIDAHADLRLAYQGFTSSHASIMHNILQLPLPPQKLVQVGIRDFCQEEYEEIQRNPIISTFFAPHMHDALFRGETWAHICQKICEELPKRVYISFDIDGLSPAFCPGTGTPVPGGLSFEQIRFLLNTLAQTNIEIIGFDLNEVAPSPQGEWDGNVGARILYQLIGCRTFDSQKI
jgi:agmatinase